MEELPELRRLAESTRRRAVGGADYEEDRQCVLGLRSHCYGPVMTVLTANGDLQEAATFCRDGSVVVPLKD
jgi:hypothetical protein